MNQMLRWVRTLVATDQRLSTVATLSIALIFLLVLSVMLTPGLVAAAEIDDAEQLFLTGQYSEATALAQSRIEVWNERWPRLLIQCQLATGQYVDAKTTYDAAISRHSNSFPLRMLGLEVLRLNDDLKAEKAARESFKLILQRTSARAASRDNLIAIGQFFVEEGEDAKRVLELFYDPVRDAYPDYINTYIATAELAIQKGDYKVASQTLQAAQKIDGTDPRVAYLQARAWESSDSQKATESLDQALSHNPRHAPSLLFQAESLIDREQYDLAETFIQRVLVTNLHDPNAWALKAVLAHLRGQYEVEMLMRAAALSTWSTNPQVDHLIGMKLSQKYRFAEGAEYQQRALEMDPSFIPAKFQLAQDLLRLGRDDEGWELAESVASDDPYNVVAHNLVTLHDRLKDFTILESDGIYVRMDSREAKIYGHSVLSLLIEAKKTLCEKYDVTPDAPIVVEIFPEQKDFAIRTFGLPGGAGFLGVCFGRVITANSPASQGERPSNWQSVLWHEFCHVVTLEKTKNRMPRWLSEGISVYEERQRNASWGESMNAQYRGMLLSDTDLVPVSQLSGSFLNPPTPLHLQFAYYESSLAVEFIIDRYGLDALKQILVDLGDGLAVNDALVRNVGSLNKLDEQFATFARGRAESFGADADWSKEELPERASPSQWEDWVKENPTNVWGLQSWAESLIASQQWEEAKKPLEKLLELGTVTGGRDDPIELLATVYRETGDADAERKILEQTIAISSDALPALRRLIEMASDQQQWETVKEYAAKVLAIHPLIPDGHVALAMAAEKLQSPELAVTALHSLDELEPVDPAALDFRLASAYQKLDQTSRAKHHVLRALEEAPRYRDALRLLLTLNNDVPVEIESSQKSSTSTEATTTDAEVAP